MWISKDGRANTVALPDPSAILGGAAVQILRSLPESEEDAVTEALEILEDEVYDAILEPGFSGGTFPEEIPAGQLLPESMTDISDVLREVSQVTIDWRLDVIMACGDLLDEDQ